jgi:hypothetical protein
VFVRGVDVGCWGGEGGTEVCAGWMNGGVGVLLSVWGLASTGPSNSCRRENHRRHGDAFSGAMRAT